MSSSILNNGQNRIVCFPEENQCNFKRDIVNCTDFNHEDYLNPNFVEKWEEGMDENLSVEEE